MAKILLPENLVLVQHLLFSISLFIVPRPSKVPLTPLLLLQRAALSPAASLHDRIEANTILDDYYCARKITHCVVRVIVGCRASLSLVTHVIIFTVSTLSSAASDDFRGGYIQYNYLLKIRPHETDSE